MFAIPFGRIFWKEYRTNRALWLACLLIGVLIQFVSWSALRRTGEASYLANGLFFQAVFIPLMYAIGCGAVMFASEREDGTNDWLLTLSAPPLPTLLGKSTFAIVSTVVLQIVMVVSANVFLAGSEPDRWWSIWVPFGVLTLIWSCLGSLLSRRVLTSVFAATFWLFLLAFVLQAIAAYFDYTDHGDANYARLQILLCINGLITLGVDCWLGWRWCHGKYVDGTVLEKFVSGVNVVSNKLLRRSAVADRLPLRAEYDQAWRRTWQRLIWQERRRSKLPLALLQIVCAMSVMFIPVVRITGERSGTSTLLWACIWLICGVTPVAMGWLAFQVDSSLQQPRFLANRGISYGSLWLAKQYVWLPRAIFIPLVMSTIAIVSLCIVSEGDRRSVLHHIPVELGSVEYNDNHEFAWGYHRVIWFALLSYGCGQLASLLFRRTMIAIIVSVFFVCIIATWGVLIGLCQLSLNWAMAFPLIAMMFITLWQMKPWLLEDQSWGRRGKIIASLIAIPVVLLALLCCERVSEAYFVQRVDPSFIEEFEHQAKARSKFELISSPAKPDLDRLSKLIAASDDAVPADPKVILELFEQNRGRLIWIDFENPEELGRLRAIREIFEKKSHQFLASGRLVESLEFQLANLKLARSIGDGGIWGWINGTSFQHSILEDLIAWANHPKQTVDSLRSGIALIEQELGRYPTFSGSIIGSYVQNRNKWVLASGAEVFRRLVEQDMLAKDASQLLVMLFLLPSERMRTSLLLTRQAEFNYASATILETELASPERPAELASRERTIDGDTFEISHPKINAELEKLAMTTPLARLSSLPGKQLEVFIKNRETEVRVALTRLNLIAYRLEHGQLPDRLIQLVPKIDRVNLIDPWSGRMFDYYPTFLFSAGHFRDALVPLNSNELVPVVPLDEDYIGGRPHIPLNHSLNENIDPQSSLQKYRARYQTLFPIPAPLKSDSE